MTLHPDFTSVHSLLSLILLISPTHIPPLHALSALHGAPSNPLQWILSPLYLSLGMQNALNPSLLNEGEFPATANIQSGYVFRIENEAAVYFLQQIGVTGSLLHLNVEPVDISVKVRNVRYWMLKELAWPAMAVLLAIVSYYGMLYHSSALQLDMLPNKNESFTSLLSPTFIAAILLLVLSRYISNLLLYLRTRPSWHGVSEPGVSGSLLVLLSRDRWARMDGLVDDLKAVSSGSWLSPETGLQSALSQISCLMVWLAVILLCGCEIGLQLYIVSVFLCGHVLACVSTSPEFIKRRCMTMNGRKICIDRSQGIDGVTQYKRRLEMAKELIKESGRRDWAEKLGMVNKSDKNCSTGADESVTM